MTGFDAFWSHYPRRVGKLVAMKAYEKAMKLATHEQIMAGVELYRAHLPREAQYIAHPATWLNQGRWLDEYEDAVLLSKLKAAPISAVLPMLADPTWRPSVDCIHGRGCYTRATCEAYERSKEKSA